MTLLGISSSDGKFKDLGVLLIRFGVSISLLLFHGLGKLKGGPEVWERIGRNISNLGIEFWPAVWGFMAMVAEFFCSILIILGILFRPAAAMLAFTMFVAALRHLNLPPENSGSGWSGASHALELLAVYAGLFLIGPGRYRISLKRRQSDFEE